MATITQLEIDELLATLKTLVNEIYQVRQQTKELEEELAKVQQDYDKKLGSLNREADTLEKLKSSLKYRLMQNQKSTSKEEKLPDHEQDNGNEVHPPPEILEDTFPKPPPISPEDLRRQRKRALADHVEYFIADSDREPILQLLNAVLHDERRDLGDMLELLSWGEIWTVRAEWERLEEQYSRLQEWQQALSERLTYWQGALHTLENSPSYDLWQLWLSTQETTEAFAITRIKDHESGQPFYVDRTYELQAGIRSEIPEGFFAKPVQLPSQREPIQLEIVVWAEDMEIEPAWMQSYIFSKTGETSLTKFQIKPTNSGHKQVRVEFLYQRHWLAKIEFEVEVVEAQEILPVS